MLGAKEIPAIVDGLKVVVFSTFAVMTGQHVSKVIFVGLQSRNQNISRKLKTTEAKPICLDLSQSFF